MQVTLLINGVDRTALLIETGWEIDEFDGSVLDTLELDLDDQDNAVTIIEGQDIIIEDNSDPTVRYFAGFIAQTHTEPEGIGRIHHLTCIDWKGVLDKSYFSKQYDNATDLAIIQDAFTEAGVTEIDTATLVKSARTIDKLTFRGASLRQMMDTVSGVTNQFWDVNKFQKLVYRPYGDVIAGANFSDSPNNSTSFPYYNFAHIKDIVQFNAVEIHGGSRLSTVTNQTYTGDASRKRFTLSVDNTISSNDYPLILRGPEGADPDIPTIDKNTGTDGTPVWTAQTVGIEEQDTGKDVVWNPAAHQVVFTTAPPNFATNSWRISGRALVRAAFIATDEASIAAVGRVFKKVLTIPEIDDDDQAIDLAKAFLLEQRAKDRITFHIQRDGLAVGETFAMTNVPIGLTAKLYQVHQLTVSLLGGTVAEYRVVGIDAI